MSLLIPTYNHEPRAPSRAAYPVVLVYVLQAKDFVAVSSNPAAEDTHLLFKGKYHSMADPMFYLLGFSCFAYVELETDLRVGSNTNQSNRRSADSHTSPYEVSNYSLHADTQNQ